MKITAQEEYSLRCLVRLARVEPAGALTIPEIALAEGLSIPYVGKLLAVLRQAGFIESVRGRAGGYHLARTTAEIRLGQLLLTLGEPLFDDPGYCGRHAGTETNGCCVHLDACSLRALWQTLEQWMRSCLDRLTLADLLKSEGEIAGLLRRRLTETAAGDSPMLVSLPVLPENQVPVAGQSGKASKATAKPK